MSITLRKSIHTEPYFKPGIAIAKTFVRRGILKSYSKRFGYCDEGENTVTNQLFHFKGRLFKIEYRSGCFMPFLLEINMQAMGIQGLHNANNTIGFFTVSKDMFPKRQFSDFDLIKKEYLAYQDKNDNWVMVLNYDVRFKDNLMTLDEAKELIDID